MPTIRHYFSSPAPIHRFFEGLSPSPVLIVMLTKALFRWQMTRSGSSPLSCPPLSRESRPGLAVTVTPSLTQKEGGQSDRPACVRSCGCTSVSTISAESTSSGKRVLPRRRPSVTPPYRRLPALREEGKGGANGDIGIDMKPRHYVTFVLSVKVNTWISICIIWRKKYFCAELKNTVALIQHNRHFSLRAGQAS